MPLKFSYCYFILLIVLFHSFRQELLNHNIMQNDIKQSVIKIEKHAELISNWPTLPVSESGMVKWFLWRLHMVTPEIISPGHKSILLSFIHQWLQSFSIILILKNDYSKYKVIDCWKVIAKMNTKVILVLMNEFIWKVKYFFLDKL